MRASFRPTCPSVKRTAVGRSLFCALRLTARNSSRQTNHYRPPSRTRPAIFQRRTPIEALPRQRTRAKCIGHYFRAFTSGVQSSAMWLLDRSDRRTPDSATSDLLERIQRLEREHTELRARLEGERQLQIFAAQIIGAAQTAPVIGEAIEKFAQAMRAPLPRGRAGGLARHTAATSANLDWLFVRLSYRIAACSPLSRHNRWIILDRGSGFASVQNTLAAPQAGRQNRLI